MADAREPVADDAGETSNAEAPGSERKIGRRLRAGVDALRSWIASIVWLFAVVCALFLALAALLVVLQANPGNAVVRFITDGARFLDLGVFSPQHGLFTPGQDPDLIRASLINWGIGAIAYLVVGKILDRLIRP